jgi:hypothetical protein
MMVLQTIAIKHMPRLHVQTCVARQNAAHAVTNTKVIGRNGYDSAIEKYVMIWTQNNDIAYDVRPKMRRSKRLKVMRFGVELIR